MAHLPAAGEMVLFDRSWYNRAGVERVMGFCTEEEYREFLRSCPEFERMLVRSGIILIKYWFSVSDEEQEKRFQARIEDPHQALEAEPDGSATRARNGWTIPRPRTRCSSTPTSSKRRGRWSNADSKKRARLNCIHHLLTQMPYKDLTPEPIMLPPRQSEIGYVRPPFTDQTFVPEVY